MMIRGAPLYMLSSVHVHESGTFISVHVRIYLLLV